MPKKTGNRKKEYVQFAVVVLWLLFLSVWFFSYAEGYSLYQNIAVIIASILVAGAIGMGPWMKKGTCEDEWEDWEEEELMKTPGFRWRVSLSIVTFFCWVIFLVIWLFFYVEGFTLFQNIGLFIASVLALVAVMAGAWVPWGMKYGPKFEKMEKAHKRAEAKKRAQKRKKRK